jgi:hypothetical protein
MTHEQIFQQIIKYIVFNKIIIIGNIIDQNMKIEMLFHIIQHCYWYGVFIWTFYILHLHISHFIY